MRKRLLVTGCGRSGTRFITRTLQEVGFRVEHEGLGGDGTVSWYFAPKTSRYPFPNRVHRDGIKAQQVSYDETFLQVRHPLRVIPSLRRSLNESDWEFVRAHIPISKRPIIREMEYWLKWNELALKREPSLVYRIEDIESHWEDICERLGIEKQPRPIVPTDLNTRGRYEFITWHYLRDTSKELTKEVEKLARKLGYDL